MGIDDQDDTKLIDVSEVQDEMAEEFSQEATAHEISQKTEIVRNTNAPEAIDTPSITSGPSRVATVGERFTACLIDGIILWWAYWAGVQLYHLVRSGHWGGAAPTTMNWNGLLFHGIFLLLAFCYYFLLEGVFSATIGKWCCRMSVRRTNGRVASLTSIFLRNLLRPLDLVLALPCMEFTAHYQRFGDLAAGTTVIRRQSTAPFTPINWNELASTTGRMIAALIDLCLVAGLLLAALLLLNDEQPFVSQWLFLVLPWALLFFWAGVQTATQTTPGHWLCGYVCVLETGAPIGLPQGLLRTLLAPVDLLIGPLALALSPRRQRIGDMIAGTLVIHRQRNLRGALSLLVVLATLAGGGVLARHNPRTMLNPEARWNDPVTWFNQEFTFTFIPRTAMAPILPVRTAPKEPFQISGFFFAEGSPDNTRQPAVFVPGETVFLVFDVRGFAMRDQKVWIQEDLAVRYPDGTYGLRQENIIDHNQIKRLPGPLVLKNNIQLPDGIPDGQYTVFITLRDKLVDVTPIVYSEHFRVKGGVSLPPDQPAQPSP